MGEIRNAYRVLVGKPEDNRLLGRPRHKWDDNSRMDLKRNRFGNVDWIHLTLDRDQLQILVNTVMNLQVPQKVGIFLTA
jgi:hypothetical protein